MREDDTAPHVVLVGEMGVGKTTVGVALARRLGRVFLDSDDHIESQTGKTGATIAEEGGVEALHDLELEALLEMCEEVRPAVIAPAASIVDRKDGRRVLAANFTIWLRASSEVRDRRRGLGTDEHRRTTDSDERAVLAGRRAPRYRAVADLVVDTSTASVADVVSEIASRLA